MTVGDAAGVRRPLGIDEVSAATGIPVNTLRWWRTNGRGPKSWKLGRRVVYDVADVHSWMQAQRTGRPA